VVDLIIAGAQIYTETGVKKNAALALEKNMIAAIGDETNLTKNTAAKILRFPATYHVIPGFIDLHIHGAYGKDVMDGDFAALETISESLAREGTTSFLATTMTAKPEEIEKVLLNVRNYIQQQQSVKGAEVLGVHLEGPFLSPKKVGAQRADLILEPNIDYLKQWQKKSDNVIKLVTIAPELPNSLEFIKFLRQQNIVASIGHTDATYAETNAAIEAGCSHVTHLFNAMRGIHHREPGVATAALLSDKVSAELIADGIHLHPAILQLAIQVKNNDKIILVTDSMRAKCLPDGEYDLGGQSVAVKQGVARLTDGTLAGGTLKMATAIKNMLQFTDCQLSDVIRFAAENPAKALNIFSHKGSIAERKDADIVVLDEQFNVVLTVCGGRVV